MPPTRERYLGIVDEETRRLERIVGDLLDLARLEGGGARSARASSSTSARCSSAWRQRHQRELTERGVQLDVGRLDRAGSS